jgi:hypothetical protein
MRTIQVWQAGRLINDLSTYTEIEFISALKRVALLMKGLGDYTIVITQN